MRWQMGRRDAVMLQALANGRCLILVGTLFSTILCSCQPCLTETGAEPDRVVFARFVATKAPMVELKNEVARFVRDEKIYYFRLDGKRVSVIDHAAESATGYIAELPGLWSAMAEYQIAQIEYTKGTAEFWPDTRDSRYQKTFVYSLESPAPITTTLDDFHPFYDTYYRTIEPNWFLSFTHVPPWE